MQRWTEQVKMVEMEMGRVLISLERRAQVWEQRGANVMSDGEISDGRRAYAA